MDRVQPDVQGPEVRLTRRRLLARTLLGGSALAGGGLLAACGSKAPDRRAAPSTPTTVTDLLAARPFYVAHRGGGGDWPEMTAYAYDRAAEVAGLHALEVSVCLSADQVLVCSHDPTTLRTTGVDLTIADQPWSALAPLLVGAATTTDPGQPGRPLSRFEDVSGHAERLVLFAEPKVEAASQPLLDQLVALGQPTRTVWKSYVSSAWFARAKQQGFSTWGYVLDQPSHLGDNLERFAASPDIDLLGVAIEESDAFVSAVVEAGSRHGKQTMVYPLRTAAQRDRAAALGCTGLMVSCVTELVPHG